MINRDIRERFALLRFIMIFGVVLLHTPEHVYINEVGTSWFDLTKAFFQNAAFRCSVPVLTCISGYLLFHSGLDEHFRALLNKKFRTLAIPFLVFNTMMGIGVLLVEAYVQLPISLQLYPLDTSKLLDALFSLNSSPVNYPLYFLRELMVLMLLAPLFSLLLRNSPLSGGILVCLIAFTDFDGDLFLRQQMPIMFYLGGLAAVRKWDVRRLDKFALPCLMLFIAACCAVLYFRLGNTRPLRLCAPFLIWPASALLVGTAPGRWLARMSKYSFFIFLTHAPVLLVLFLIYKHFKDVVPYEIFWVTAPVITATFLIYLQDLSSRLAPEAFNILTGLKVENEAKRVPKTTTREPVAELHRS